MARYNLDGGTGLFNALGNRNPAKVVKLGSGVDIKHFKMFEYINAEVLGKTDDSIKVEAKDVLKETLFFPGDHVVVNYSNTQDLFVMDGNINHVYDINPLIIDVKINKVEKLKDLRKHERFYVSLMANIRVCGTSKLKTWQYCLLKIFEEPHTSQLDLQQAPQLYIYCANPQKTEELQWHLGHQEHR